MTKHCFDFKSAKYFVPKELLIPSAWDRMRDCRHEDFLNTYKLQLDHPIVACRQAEVLIRLNRIEEAEALLQRVDHPLALGLMCKVHATREDFDAIVATAAKVPAGSDPTTLEAHVHAHEMLWFVHYSRFKLQAAQAELTKAEAIATALGLEGRLQVLALHREYTGDPDARPSTETQDTVRYNYARRTRFRTLLHAGEVAHEGILHPNEVKVIRAAIEHRNGDLPAALIHLQDDWPDEPTIKLTRALLQMDLFLRTGDALRAPPAEAITAIEEVVDVVMAIDFDLREAVRFFPLAIKVLGYHKRLAGEFKLAAATVPIILAGKGIDGLWASGQRLSWVPRGSRIQIMEEQARLARRGPVPPKVIAGPPGDRSKFKRALENKGLAIEQVITVYLKWLGLSRLGRALDDDDLLAEAASLRAEVPFLDTIPDIEETI